ncbi:acetylcholinesterase isoform X2 [Frankliniella occidentalis]|uniref:Carboxylic ester hydrolase n=1 Tax=Frankliniella occidentalis TaxID=133901 RepID=A0A6J1SGL6_FRAOC|nr:acetylcholinesterase isoform X2 [Frankliniella occidentalis]
MKKLFANTNVLLGPRGQRFRPDWDWGSRCLAALVRWSGGYAPSQMQLVEVQTKQGLLRGQRLTPPHKNVPQFDAFLGVPYAKPPVKELRFKAPQPPEPWEGALPALDHRADSPQFDTFITQKNVGSDDCLYLNVYSPQVPSSVRHPVEGAPWPVMVWFHPGGFTNGTARMSQFAPEHLVARGVVVVTVTYRLGAFGFLSLRSPKLPGNAGLKDGVASLRWVRDNIAVFGGDPGRVTVFGCSAGSALVEYLMLAPSARGLFHRAISQSGSATNQWAGVLPPDEARARAFRLGEALGCRTEDEDELIAFLQAAPTMDILDKSFDVVDPEKEGPKGLLFPFLPVSEAGVESDDGEEAFLPDEPRKLLASQRFFPVPWIVGLTDCEGLLTVMDDQNGAGITCRRLDVVEDDLERVVPAELELQKGSPESKAVAEGIRKLYFKGGKVELPGYFNLYTDLLFTAGVTQAARMHAAHPNAAPVYFYLFSVVGGNNILTAFLMRSWPELKATAGACHGDENGYLWGRRAPLPPEPEWEPHSLEATTRRRLTALWTNFARTGVPAPPSDPDVEGVDWKPLPATSDVKAPIEPYLDIGVSLGVPRAPLWEERVSFWDGVFDKD